MLARSQFSNVNRQLSGAQSEHITNVNKHGHRYVNCNHKMVRIISVKLFLVMYIICNIFYFVLKMLEGLIKLHGGPDLARGPEVAHP